MNKESLLREYRDEDNLSIDGRDIPYQIRTATDYLLIKNENWNEDDVYNFYENNSDLCKILNQIIALKQACVLFRHTRYSCQSLPNDLFQLKIRLIKELKQKYNYEFDEKLYESYPKQA